MRLNENLPAGMKLTIAYDSSVFIERSIDSVFHTIGEAIILVVLVIFFFLRNLRASIIPIVTIPVSVSYTHLDVYKRQAIRPPATRPGTRPIPRTPSPSW